MTNLVIPVSQVQFDRSNLTQSAEKAVVSANHIDECVTKRQHKEAQGEQGQRSANMDLLGKLLLMMICYCFEL